MIRLFGVLGAILVCAALYSFCAALVCIELNRDKHHWWCPLCQITRAFARRYL